MATHAIGKLKFSLSDRGLAYRWGDGEAHRLFQGKNKQADADDYMDEAQAEGDAAYQDDYDARDAGYDGDRYDDPDGDYDDYDGPDDGYDDDGYDEPDDGYDDDGYDEPDDGYDGGYDDDRYDDGYEDGGYADDRYDDRYQDRDADDAAYDGGDGYYDDQGSLMRYVDENDWVTYVLLFLFPPLGIYLLWRRNRFDKPVRWAITAASAIWFVVALILLLRGLFGGAGDQQVQPEITLPPESVAVEAIETPVETEAPAEEITTIDLGGSGDLGITDLSGDADTADTGDTGLEIEENPLDTTLEDTEPSPTALPGGTGTSSADTAAYVWSPASGLYYHSTDSCTRIEDGVSLSRVTKEIAENSRHQSPCPDCIGGGTTATYYATVGGKYYHTDSKCSSMRNPLVYTKQAAENEGKTPCPVCILKTKTSLEETEDVGTVLINKDTPDKSNIQVYATKNGTYFHVRGNCSGMQDAVKGSLRDALLAGKKACPTCCASAGTLVYCTSGGKSYHVDRNCQGMTGAKQVTLAEAMVLGKTKCNVCIKGSLDSVASGGTTAAGNTVTLGTATGDDVKVYATKNGTYYHTNSACSGMKDAQLYTLKSMLLAGKKACPTCASSANTKVYATKGGKYYHSYATCSGMTGANSGTLADALVAGLKRCPNCWGNKKSSNAATTTSTKAAAATTTTTGGTKAAATTAAGAKATTATTKAAAQTVSSNKAQAAASKATASNTYVYATKSGAYYHLNSGCGGMTGASRVTLKTAINAGKKACPTCASAATRTVYSTSNGSHYHVASVCAPSGMKNGTKRTLAQALMKGQTACPYCLSSKKAAMAAAAAASGTGAKTATVPTATATYSSGKSGVRVYATLSDKYYHTRSNCSSLSGTPSRITLETALNYGKKACPNCASTATRTVYATKGGKYYHYSMADAGAGAKQGTLASALAYGFDPCPNCVKGGGASQAATADQKYTAGASGIKVYATQGSKYYHSTANCSGLTGASRVSLETALNYGKKACPVCLAAANIKVYAAPGDSYYHYYKAHAGSGATAGTLAVARACGLKACPQCSKLSEGAKGPENGGTEDAPVSIEEYPAAADSAVYIDISTVNSYYHTSATCGKAKFSGGTKVTLQYALDWDYKACPYCNPPTSAIPVDDVV